MTSKENEYKEIFMAEALDNFEELNRLLTALEKNPSDKSAMDAIFRITHTLKGNAAGMGFDQVAELSHVIEDLFSLIRDGKIKLNEPLFKSIFKGIDTLGALIQALESGKNVPFKGIKTKLEVLIRKNQDDTMQSEDAKVPDPAPPVSEDDNSSLEQTEADSVIHEEADSKTSQITFSDLVQVPVRKLDSLLNLVGELVIERDRLIATYSGIHGSNEFNRLNRISSDLQYSVMDVRLVQVGFLFNKFHRVVRDAASIEGKKVDLKLEGTDTEIDRNILQIISDSMIHLVRNAVGHGIESEEQRKKAGKPQIGEILLTSRAESDSVLIEIKDDGAGIDPEKVKQKAIQRGLLHAEMAHLLSKDDILMYIFEPGFSTMDKVTSLSGRGVGMDVVKKAIDSIGGQVGIKSELGTGTTVSLTLPSSMAVKGVLLFELDKTPCAIALSYTQAVISVYKNEIHKVGRGLAATHLGKTISIVFLNDVFDRKPLHHSFNQLHPEQKLNIIVVNHNNRTVGLVVDKLLQQKEIVEKPLGKPLDDKANLISGLTILGNGSVCLVINVAVIVHQIFEQTNFKDLNLQKDA